MYLQPDSKRRSSNLFQVQQAVMQQKTAQQFAAHLVSHKSRALAFFVRYPCASLNSKQAPLSLQLHQNMDMQALPGLEVHVAEFEGLVLSGKAIRCSQLVTQSSTTGHLVSQLELLAPCYCLPCIPWSPFPGV